MPVKVFTVGVRGAHLVPRCFSFGILRDSLIRVLERDPERSVALRSGLWPRIERRRSSRESTGEDSTIIPRGNDPKNSMDTLWIPSE